MEVVVVHHRPLEAILEDEVELEKWRRAQKPVCIRGCLSSWPAMRKWTGAKGKEHLKAQAGSASIEVMCSKSDVFFGAIGAHTLMRCTLAEFLDETKQREWLEISLHTYLAQARLHEGPLAPLMEDLPYPPKFVRPDLQFNLWMSFKSACRSSPHYDFYENLLCLIEGSKLVKLYPPSMTPCFYPYPMWSESPNHSSVHFVSPDLKKHPQYREVMDSEIHVSLQPGDVLYIPEGWWHQVDTTQNTIAVNIWWRSKESKDVTEGPLSHYYFRAMLRSMTHERVDQIIHSIEPLHLDPPSMDTQLIIPLDAQSAPLDPRTQRLDTEDASLSETKKSPSGEGRGLCLLTELLKQDRVNAGAVTQTSLKEMIQDPIVRWLCTFDAFTVCETLETLAQEDLPQLQSFWKIATVTPAACHILSEHFQTRSIHAPQSDSLQFYDTVFDALDDREKALEEMHHGGQELFRMVFEEVLNDQRQCFP